jgi:hypothetical protein
VPDGVGEIYEKFGQHTTIRAKKENFWKALFRKSKSDENTNTLHHLR